MNCFSRSFSNRSENIKKIISLAYPSASLILLIPFSFAGRTSSYFSLISSILFHPFFFHSSSLHLSFSLLIFSDSLLFSIFASFLFHRITYNLSSLCLPVSHVSILFLLISYSPFIRLPFSCHVQLPRLMRIAVFFLLSSELWVVGI